MKLDFLLLTALTLMVIGCTTYSLVEELELPEEDHKQVVAILKKEMKYELVSVQILDNGQIKVVSHKGQPNNGREQSLFIAKSGGSWKVQDEHIKIYDP